MAVPVAPDGGTGPRRVFAASRAAMAVAMVAAVVGQLQVSLSFWAARGDENIPVDVVNFFSYFTIQSTIFHAVVLLLGAWSLRRRPGAEPARLGSLRAAATTYTVTTGIVYNALLRGIPMPAGLEQPWSNEVLHLIVPLYAVLDWSVAPGRHPVRWRTVGWIVVYPVLWAAYTLVRAPFVVDQATGASYWYPYPFLDPHGSGYGTVALWVAALAVVITVVAAVVVGISRRRPPAAASGTATMRP